MFKLIWLEESSKVYQELLNAAHDSLERREKIKKTKSSKTEGLFKQIHKALSFLEINPKHPGLQTHEYFSLSNPYDPTQKVLEAYAQNQTPGAYRIFWCYGPNKNEITIISIIPHP